VKYLASPYTTDDSELKENRYIEACKAAARLLSNGVNVICPIAATHGLHVHGNCSMRWNFWKEYDEELLSKCDGLIVLMLDGWDKSVGVQAEIEYAKKLGLTIEYMRWE